MVCTSLLLGFTILAAATDMLRHKIYNWTTYPGIVAALVANFWEKGGTGLADSLTGFFFCGFMMLGCFALFNIGGGDVKLVAMLGAFLGPEKGLEAMLWTFVFGAIAGLSVLIWRVGLIKLVSGTVRHIVLTLRLATWLPLSDEERKQLQPPLYLAPAALLAVIVVRFSLVEF